jgi:hypothetical protein
MAETEPRDWLYPRLEALVADAEQAGIARELTVALVTDIINGPPFNVGPEPTADEDWNKDVGETDAMVNLDTTGGLTPLNEPVVGVGLATFGRSRTGGRGQGRL